MGSYLQGQGVLGLRSRSSNFERQTDGSPFARENKHMKYPKAAESSTLTIQNSPVYTEKIEGPSAKQFFQEYEALCRTSKIHHPNGIQVLSAFRSEDHNTGEIVYQFLFPLLSEA